MVAVSSEPAQLQRHALALGQVQVEGGLSQRHTLVLQHALDAGHVTPAADQLQLRRLHRLKQFDRVGDGGGCGDEGDQDEGQHDDDDLGVSEMTDQVSCLQLTLYPLVAAGQPAPLYNGSYFCLIVESLILVFLIR